MNPHLGMRRREPLQILAVPGEDLGSSCFYGLGHDEGVHGRGGAGRPQKLPGNAPMDLMGHRNRTDRLQHTVDGSVARSTASGRYALWVRRVRIASSTSMGET